MTIGFLMILDAYIASSPIKAQWEYVPPLFKPNYAFRCNRGEYTMFYSSIVNTVADFAVMATPIPLVWNLRLPVRQRIAVISLFSLGMIVCLAGVVRTIYLDKALLRSYDETWVGWPLWIATAVEIDLGIVSPYQPPLPLANIILIAILNSFAHRSQHSDLSWLAMFLASLIPHVLARHTNPILVAAPPSFPLTTRVCVSNQR